LEETIEEGEFCAEEEGMMETDDYSLWINDDEFFFLIYQFGRYGRESAQILYICLQCRARLYAADTGDLNKSKHPPQ